jgi:hypothetical protein
MGLVQRLKLWRDNYSNLHSITVFANRSSRQYHEYELYWFDAEPRSKDDRTRQMRLGVRGRRGSTSDLSRRFSFNRIRPRQRSVPGAGQGESSHAAAASPALEIKYLGLQFSHRDGKFPRPSYLSIDLKGAEWDWSISSRVLTLLTTESYSCIELL